jgi:hypothetical protein
MLSDVVNGALLRAFVVSQDADSIEHRHGSRRGKTPLYFPLCTCTKEIMASPRRQRRFADILRFSGGAPRIARRKRTAARRCCAVQRRGTHVRPDHWTGPEHPSTLAIQSFFATAGLIQELAVGSDGNVWFAFLEQSWIGRTLYARRRRADLADGRMVVRSRARR